jgi:hypothetical protein
MFPHSLNFVGTDWEQWEQVENVPNPCSLCSHPFQRLWEQRNPVLARVSGKCSHVPTVPTVFLFTHAHVRARIAKNVVARQILSLAGAFVFVS